MTVTDQIKILDEKIKQNEAQYNLDREAAKISAFSSNNSDKYEYLTGEDLDLKPSTVEQAKFEYSPLGKIFNKGLSKDDKKEGILKRLENIKDKNDELLNTINTTNKASKNKINNQSKKLVYNTEHSFSKLKNISDIKKLSLDSMFNLMRKHHKKFISLKNLTPQTENNKKLKQEVLINAGGICNSLYYIYKNKYNKKINSLDTENRTKLDYKKLRLSDYRYLSEEEQEEEQQEDQEEKEQKETKTDIHEFSNYIAEEEAHINKELFIKHFNYQKPSDMLNHLYETNDINNNNKSVSVICSGIKDLKKEIKEMSKEERKIEKPDNIAKVVEEILKFNKQYQEGQGIKMLTPNQILSRLPISLAQLKAGNNSEKRKNEIRQLLYSRYRSKNMTKQVYNNSIKPI